MTKPKRTCFYIPVGQFDEKGYIPSVVTEGEAGHSPLMGNGPFAEPWYWGKTYQEALSIAARANADKGLTEADVAEIMSSSMAATGEPGADQR